MRRRTALHALSATALAGSALLFGRSVAFARGRPPTPTQSEGPFYPPDWPADAGWNLIGAGNGRVAARGEPLALDGRVLDRDGGPLAGARVEIWQCDAGGRYRHPRAGDGDGVDPGFRGFGATATDAAGRYRFLTLVPVSYPGRTPHIHARVKVAGRSPLTTQLYLEDHPRNARDFLLGALGLDERARLMLRTRPARLPEGIDGQSAQFDYVL